jgi:hypothetical protein
MMELCGVSGMLAGAMTPALSTLTTSGAMHVDACGAMHTSDGDGRPSCVGWAMSAPGDPM